MAGNVIGKVLALGFLLSIALSSPAECRPGGPSDIGSMASSPVIVVGEVLSVGRSTAPQRDKSANPVVGMIANVRVLRSAARGLATCPSPGSVTTIAYRNYAQPDTPIVNGYEFPELKPGECRGFPLTMGSSDGKAEYELTNWDGSGIVIPCLREKPSGPTPTSVRDLFFAELANTLAHGSVKDVYELARFLSRGWWDDSGCADAIIETLAPQLVDDSRRWLDIALATYNLQPIQRGKIGEPPIGRISPLKALSAKAFDRVQPVDMTADKIIRVLFEHEATLGRTAFVGYTLALNYPDNPMTIQLLREGLSRHDPRALDTVERIRSLQGSVDSSLISASLDAAMGVIANPKVRSLLDLWSACVIIRDRGSKEQFSALLEQLKSDIRKDHDRFLAMWSHLEYVRTKRMIPLIRIAITDRKPMYYMKGQDVVRVCDSAVGVLQRVTGADLGVTPEFTKAQREASLKKAVRWLSTHPDS